MNTAKKLMLLNLGGVGSSGAAAITYLFRDEFTTDEAAPLTSPRTCEPGPGTLTIVDTVSVWKIDSGALKYQSAGPGVGQLGAYGQSLSRVVGRMVRAEIIGPTAAASYPMWLGWWRNTNMNYTSGANVAHGWYTEALTWRAVSNATTPIATPSTFAAGTTYGLAIILRSTGAAYFINAGSGWALRWVSYEDATSPVYPVVAPASEATNQNASVNYLQVFDLPAPFTTDEGIATLNEASPADATAYTGDANGIIGLTVTAPGSLDGDPTTRCGFYYRADADLTPAWHCYVAGDGTFNLDSIASDGTRTNRITVAAVIAAGGTRTLRVIATATVHNAYTLSSTTWTKRGAAITLSLNDAVTRIIPSVPAGWSIANLRSYPRTSSAYDELDRS